MASRIVAPFHHRWTSWLPRRCGHECSSATNQSVQFRASQVLCPRFEFATNRAEMPFNCCGLFQINLLTRKGRHAAAASQHSYLLI